MASCKEEDYEAGMQAIIQLDLRGEKRGTNFFDGDSSRIEIATTLR